MRDDSKQPVGSRQGSPEYGDVTDGFRPNSNYPDDELSVLNSTFKVLESLEKLTGSGKNRSNGGMNVNVRKTLSR